MIEVSNADRIVFPEVGRTKGDVAAYYERIGARALVHVAGRPLSIKRFPKGLAGPGFFQKNVPAHYPASIARFAIERSRAASKKHARAGKPPAEDVTVAAVLSAPDQLAYLANHGAIELHVTTARAGATGPDRLVLDLDPPPGATALVQRAAHLVREALSELEVETVPVATGSKGYHVVAALTEAASGAAVAVTAQRLAALLAARHPDELTTAYRIAQRGDRVFIDWLRNRPGATVVAPYSLRARPGATAAVPLAWSELDTTAPDAFAIGDVERLLDRPDSLAERGRAPTDTDALAARVAEAFERSGLVLETFYRFRS